MKKFLFFIDLKPDDALRSIDQIYNLYCYYNPLYSKLNLISHLVEASLKESEIAPIVLVN